MIRFSVVLSVVVVAVGLLVAGAVSAILALVYAAIALAGVALLMLIIGVVVWRDEIFERASAVGAGALAEAADGSSAAPPAGSSSSAPAALGTDQRDAVPAAAAAGMAADARPADGAPAADAVPTGDDRASEAGPRVPAWPGLPGDRQPGDRQPGHRESETAGRAAGSRSEPSGAGSRPASENGGPASENGRAPAPDSRSAAPDEARPGGDPQRTPDAGPPPGPRRPDDRRSPDELAPGRRGAGDRRGPEELAPGRRGPDPGSRDRPDQARPGPEREPVRPAAAAPSGLGADAAARSSDGPPNVDELLRRARTPAAAAGPPGPVPPGPERPGRNAALGEQARPEPDLSGPPRPETVRPDAARGGPDRPEMVRPETAVAATARPEAVRPDGARPAAGIAASSASPAVPPAGSPAVPPAGSPAVPPASSLARPGPAGPTDSAVTVVPGIGRYHRSECILIRFLGEEDLEVMTKQAALAAGAVPCKACRPD